MKKLVAVFVLAVLAPSLILAGLAFRSLRDQEMVVERQQALLLQSMTDSLASDSNVFMDDIRIYFRDLVDELLADGEVDAVSAEFDSLIRKRWAQVEVGAVVSESGNLISPSTASPDPRIQMFCVVNNDFLTNKSIEEVYQAAPQMANTIEVEEVPENAPADSFGRKRESKGVAPKPAAESRLLLKEKVSVQSSKLQSQYRDNRAQDFSARQEEAQQTQQADLNFKTRNLVPLSQAQTMQPNADDAELNANPWSMLVTQRGEFTELIGNDEEGAFSRFLKNRLHVLLWYRPAGFSDRIFCAQLDLDMLKSEVGRIIEDFPTGRSEPKVCMALLDETGQPVSINRAGFTTDWGAPFVASEVGEILPHWEVAAYLVNPGALNRVASSFRFTLGLMILVLIAAIGFGSLLICLDLARQARDARQKTDFVSNVSHELKTPLTSILMFSDLLSANSTAAPEKRHEYAGIIGSEAARLSRLINNLLDFSRLDRNERKYDRQRLDLDNLVGETLDHYRDHLGQQGVTLELHGTNGDGSMEIDGDHDALAQVLLNLVSNAAKYGGDSKEITVELVRANGNAEVRVMDRGPGVSRKNQERIFKKFYRVDDSLSSGIQGSGLGLTLARSMARAHGGDITYRNREGGGSVFVLSLPLMKGGSPARAESAPGAGA